MKRREFVAFLGGAAALPFVRTDMARAQPRGKKLPRIGIVDDGPIWKPFRDALHDAGYVQGQSVAFDYRVAEGKPDRLASASAELARIPVDVIAAYGTPASIAAKAATSTIPIVIISVGDPVRAGLVRSLARPGANVTGNTILASDISPKRLQLIKEVIPSASRVTLLCNPDNISNVVIREQLEAAAPTVGLKFSAIEARSLSELMAAFAAIARDKPDVAMVTSDPLHQSHIQKIVTFMFQQGLPAMYQTKDNVAAGGLMSYGASFPDLFRNGASYVVKILRGAKPGELPVLPPERFELAINLKTAKAIGLKISESVLLRADDVIE